MVWGSILVWFRRRRRVIARRLDSAIAAETIIRSPEPVSYRGATVAGYPIVNNDGMIALSRRRLVFQTLTGKVIEGPVTEIAGVREADAFKTAKTAARQHLIIQTSPGEIGFYVGDNAAWVASLTTVGARPILQWMTMSHALRRAFYRRVARGDRTRSDVVSKKRSRGIVRYRRGSGRYRGQKPVPDLQWREARRRPDCRPGLGLPRFFGRVDDSRRADPGRRSERPARLRGAG